MNGRRMAKKTYHIDPSDAGLVIGSKGAGINSLKKIPHVHNVFLDTKSYLPSYKLIVSATSIDVCDSVFCEVKKRINEVEKRNQKGGYSEKIYFDEGKPYLTSIAIKPILSNNNVVYRILQSLYKIDRFESCDLSDAMGGLQISHNDSNRKETFCDFSKNDFVTSIEQVIQQNQGENMPFRFTASPGKLAFQSMDETYNQPRLLLCERLKKGGRQYLKDINITTRFSPNLNPNLMKKLTKNLSENGFKLLNEEGEKFTIIHLFTGDENTFFHVQLADNLDDNLESTSRDDMRLSLEKKVFSYSHTYCN